MLMLYFNEKFASKEKEKPAFFILPLTLSKGMNKYALGCYGNY